MGIEAAFAAIVDAVLGAETVAAAGTAGLLGDLGVGLSTAGLIGDAVGTGLLGAGGGALLGGITGGDPGAGALGGFLTGGLGSLGGAAGAGLGIGETAGAALGAAGGGAAGAAATGSNPLTGALEGGAASLLSSAVSGGFNPAPSGGGTGSAANALDLPGTTDLTKALGTTGADAFTNASAAPVLTGGEIPNLGSGTGATGAAPAIPSIAAADAAKTFSGGIPSVDAASQLKTGTGASGPTSGGQLFKDVTSGNLGKLPGDLGTLIEKNPMAAISAAGLGYSALNQPSLPTGQIDALTAQAKQLGAQGSNLSSYLFNGQLPQGAQTALDQATASANAKVKSDYARLGLSGSSAEGQALQSVRDSATTQRFQLAQNLLKTGIDETGLSSKLYEAIYASSQTQNRDLMSAIASFAAAVAGGGGGKGTTINIPGLGG
jgi:hypothetical protein